MKFEFRKYKHQELIDEYNKLQQRIKNDDLVEPIRPFKIGYLCTNYFFQYERFSTGCKDNKFTPLEYWDKSQERIIVFAKKHNNSVYSTLNYFSHTPSQFPPLTACLVYKEFKCKNILDPYAGWGDRCLAAMSMNLNYTGVDCNTNLKTPYKKMISTYPTSEKIKIIHSKCEKVNLNKINFDFVFTSPPFWKNKKILEKYNGTELNYDVFMNTSLIPTLKKCISRNTEKIWICLYINKDMYNDLKKVIGECKREIKFKTGGTSKTYTIYCWYK